MDQLISPIMADLAACLEASVEENTKTAHGGGAVCVTTLLPGQLAPMDWCSCGRGKKNCGMAWVRLDRLYPAGDNFPSQDVSTKTSCVSVLAAVLEVGVYRCRAVSASTAPIPPETRTNEALLQAADAMAMHKAIKCCESITSRPNLLGFYQPRDGGDCGGGAWTVTVKLLRR